MVHMYQIGAGGEAFCSMEGCTVYMKEFYSHTHPNLYDLLTDPVNEPPKLTVSSIGLTTDCNEIAQTGMVF